MSFTAGIDVGSTYTKAVIVDRDGRLFGRAMLNTGFRLGEAAASALWYALAAASARRNPVLSIALAIRWPSLSRITALV